MNSRGIALLMGLVLLAAISLFALMATNGMLVQRRMSANFDADNQALAQAARASSAARTWLDSLADVERETGCVTDCLLPVAVHGPGELPHNPEFESAAWWRSHAMATGTHPETGDVLPSAIPELDPPRWIIEELHYESLNGAIVQAPVEGIGYYRILARGSGSNSAGGVAVTESIVAHPWEGAFEPLPYPGGGPAASFCRQFDSVVPCGLLAWRQRR